MSVDNFNKKPVKSSRSGSTMPNDNGQGKVWAEGIGYVWEKIKNKRTGDTYRWDGINLLYWNENGDEEDYVMMPDPTATELPNNWEPITNSRNITSARRGEVDTIAADELALCTENDGDLYRQMTTPIIKNLKGKIAKGTYDEQLALKAWLNLVTAEARKYVREFGSPGDTIDRMFNLATREEAAKEVARYYEDHIHE